MSLAELVKRMAALGASADIIAVAVEAVEACATADADRRAKRAAQKRKERETSRYIEATVARHDSDIEATVDGLVSFPSSPSSSPPITPLITTPSSHPSAGIGREAEFKIGITAAFREARSMTINPQTHRAGVWLAQGYDPGICLATIRAVLAQKPNIRDLKYFDQPIADAHVKPEGVAKSTGPPRSGKRDPFLKNLQDKMQRATHERDSDPTILDGAFVAGEGATSGGVHAVRSGAGGPRLADTG